MTFTYVNRSHGKTISRTVSQVSRFVYVTFTYLGRSHGKTSLVPQYVISTCYYITLPMKVKMLFVRIT